MSNTVASCVEELLAAGIDVISTVNIQHLESVNDIVERITGVQQRETLPDEVVRKADQVELVDMTPEALRRRMAHGNIYRPEKVDAALANYFRPGNLAALRELALLWVADKVDESLQQYMEDHGITAAWEARERIVVALTGAPGGEHLVRRASRMATRAKGDLLGRSSASVGLDEAHDHVRAARVAAICLVEHRERLPDAGSGAEVYAEAAARHRTIRCDRVRDSIPARSQSAPREIPTRAPACGHRLRAARRQAACGARAPLGAPGAGRSARRSAGRARRPTP